MTNLTTGWAVMNSSKKEKPPVVAGLIISRGFMASVQSQSRGSPVTGLSIPQPGSAKRQAAAAGICPRALPNLP